MDAGDRAKGRPESRTTRVHLPPRTLDERRRNRASGVGPNGRPTARALGISPRQLRQRDPSLSMAQAWAASRELLALAHRSLDHPELDR
jgi:hypothetical protein